MRCLICGNQLNGCVCPRCGFDLSQCRERYPTLTVDRRNPEAVWSIQNRLFMATPKRRQTTVSSPAVDYQTWQQTPTSVPVSQSQTAYAPEIAGQPENSAPQPMKKKKRRLIPVFAASVLVLGITVWFGTGLLRGRNGDSSSSLSSTRNENSDGNIEASPISPVSTQNENSDGNSGASHISTVSTQNGSESPTEKQTDKADTLVVACNGFSEEFSPFYTDSTTEDIIGMVGLRLMTLDREGGIVYNAVEGETIPYNGVDHFYTGPADLSVNYDPDANLAVYTARLREDLRFWDGEPVTARDVLFTYYVLLDPSFDGTTYLYRYNILGLDSWRSKDTAAAISGIKMLDDYTVEITVQGYTASDIYDILNIPITPMHYYGDPDLWDPDHGMYGFQKGNLDRVLSRTDVPRGAGPYIFESCEDQVVTLTASPYWYKGEPKIKTILFRGIPSGDFTNALVSGDADIAEIDGNRYESAWISEMNSNDKLSGDVITTLRYNFLGYGYIGLNADTVNVDGDPGSKESKALRTALATIIAVYREAAYMEYYGEAASVIQYPISSESWAAPRDSDPDYRIAFSMDANGREIYTADMTSQQKYAAAKEAALTWLQTAGYTVKNGKVTAAPRGAKLTFEAIVPGLGVGDHPSYSVLTLAKAAFEEIGITLDIIDPADSDELFDAIDAGTQELWCLGWIMAIDPDLYQVYHSNNIDGRSGFNSNHYHLADDELDELILVARTSDDRSFRKAVYRECLDIIADWAVEIPGYQRQIWCIVSTKRINVSTLPSDITACWRWTDEIETLELN